MAAEVETMFYTRETLERRPQYNAERFRRKHNKPKRIPGCVK